MTDGQLLLFMQQEDRAAFAAIYYRHARALLNVARKRLASNMLAADIVHDVFIEFHHRANHLPPTTNIAGYLHTSVRNRVLNELRNQWIRQRHLQAIAKVSTEYSEPDTPVQEHALLQSRISSCLKQLSPRCREAFILSREEELSNQEIASRMGISVNTVEKHIGKALAVLRNELNGAELGVIVLSLYLGLH